VRTVLIVDDTEASAAALELVCAAIPALAVRTASSALAAVAILCDPGVSICAVLTDIRMPQMDGFELIRFIRGDERLAAVPIVAVTADTDPATPERAALLGANAFFAKPFSPRAVRETLERLLDAHPLPE
jgi:CheY-like chemotaxis protein